jgi:archaellum component FlaC
MSCIRYQDDWIHVDDYSAEVERLENRIEDLKDELENRANDEVFTLCEVILARDKLLEGSSIDDVIADLNELIAAHDASIRVAAMSKINEMEGV